MARHHSSVQAKGLKAKGLKLVREAGGEKVEIRRDADGHSAVRVSCEGVEITNIKVSNHHAERNRAVIVQEGARRR